MKRFLVTALSFFCLSSPQAFTSDFLEMTCRDDETQGYCMALLQGFLTGYKMGHHNGTFNATAVGDDKGPELCIPRDVTTEEIYEAMYPHLRKDLGFLDLSLFIAAQTAYPCDMQNKN